MPTGAGLRPGAKAPEEPPDPTDSAPALDPTGERGGRKRTHGTRPAARLRKRRISHRPPTGYAPLLDSTEARYSGSTGRGGTTNRVSPSSFGGCEGVAGRAMGRWPGAVSPSVDSFSCFHAGSSHHAAAAGLNPEQTVRDFVAPLPAHETATDAVSDDRRTVPPLDASAGRGRAEDAAGGGGRAWSSRAAAPATNACTSVSQGRMTRRISPARPAECQQRSGRPPGRCQDVLCLVSFARAVLECSLERSVTASLLITPSWM